MAEMLVDIGLAGTTGSGVGHIHKLLTNTIYIGRWKFNQTSLKTHKRKANDEIVETPVPVIIDTDIFERVWIRCGYCRQDLLRILQTNSRRFIEMRTLGPHPSAAS